MAALGSCPSATGPAGYVVVNEVSTVAAAYAMAGFATDATHVGSSGTALALTGIKNAFANAANLETLSTGAALGGTPRGEGGVAQAAVNTPPANLPGCVRACEFRVQHSAVDGDGGRDAGPGGRAKANAREEIQPSAERLRLSARH